ncbi:Os09g0479166 [Oryza sativa Japonica Group]|uniref:Os09g0479166 protein n=1 Tax=Oryza sativa subsp. japonica TaxID=39947 RepID=A0A0P0XPR7_ORYSJ|nr:Os09g0479166 [Oryza sativa Japonica Group]
MAKFLKKNTRMIQEQLHRAYADRSNRRMHLDALSKDDDDNVQKLGHWIRAERFFNRAVFVLQEAFRLQGEMGAGR